MIQINSIGILYIFMKIKNKKIFFIYSIVIVENQM